MGIVYIPVEIRRVLELEGAFRPDFNCPVFIYAHISEPVKKDGIDVQYALMAICPQHGMMDLGDINPKTRMFKTYDPQMINSSFYERVSNHVVKRVMILSDQLNKLRTLDDVLATKEISVKRELIPNDK